MARKKRLNKRLIMILAVVGGSVLVIGLILFVQYRFRDPLPFLESAREGVEQVRQAQEAIDTEVSQISDPEQAYLRRLEWFESDDIKQLRAETDDDFGHAFAYSRDDIVLKTEVGMELADYCLMIKDYRRARGVWMKLIEINPTFEPAKYKTVNAIYKANKIGARYSPSVGSWEQLKQQAEGYIELAPDRAYGYQAQAQAMLGIIQVGGDENPDRSLEEIEALLARAEELGGSSVVLFDLKGQYAQAKAAQSLDESEEAEYLAQAPIAYQGAIDSFPDDPEGYINRFIRYNLPEAGQLINKIATVTLEENREQYQSESDAYAEDLVKAIEQVIARFPDDGRFYHLKSRILMSNARTDGLDQIIAVYGQAIEVEPDEPKWVVEMATMYRLQMLHSKMDREKVHSVFSLLRRALFLPKAIDQQGFDRVEVITYRGRNLQLQIEFGAFLVESSDESDDKDFYLSAMRSCFIELRDLLGGLNPTTKVSQGTLARAEGKRDEAIRYYYEAEREMSTQGIANPILSLQLFYILRDTTNRSLAIKHAYAAIQGGHRSPKLYLDVMATLDLMRTHESMAMLGGMVESYEILYTADAAQRQRLETYRAKSLLARGQQEAAIEILKGIEGDSFDVKMLQVNTEKDLEKQMVLLESLVRDYPEKEQLVIDLCNFYIRHGRENVSYYDRARTLIKGALESNPDQVLFRQMSTLLASEDLGQLNPQDLLERYVESAKEISDPFEREKQLGNLLSQLSNVYLQKGQEAKSTELLQQARDHYQVAFEHNNDDTGTLVQAFAISVSMKDWTGGQALADQVFALDAERGLLMSAEILLNREKFEEATRELEAYLADYPTSVEAHTKMVRAYIGLNQLEQAMAEARRAQELDVTYLAANRLLVLLLHQQYFKQGLESISESSLREMVSLVGIVYASGGREDRFLRLRLLYEQQFMVFLHRQLTQQQGLDEEVRIQVVEKIDLVYQRSQEGLDSLLQRNPSDVLNWQALATVHQQYLEMRSDPDEQQQLRATIDKVYRDGLAANPDSTSMTAIYCQHLLQTDRRDEAEQKLQELLEKSSGEQKLAFRLQMAQMYMQVGDFDKTKAQLDEVLLEEPDNILGLQMLGEWYARNKALDEAIKIYAKLNELAGNESIVARQAELLTQVQKIEEADILLTNAREAYPESMVILLVSTKLEIFKTNYAQAHAYVDRVLESNANHLGAIELKAQALYYDQQYDAAVEMMRELRRIVGSDSIIGRAFLAQIYVIQARYSDAIKELREALKIEPANETLLNQLVRTMTRSQRWMDLEAVYAELLQRYPQSIQYHLRAAGAAMNYGDILLRGKQERLATQQYVSASNMLERAIQLCHENNANVDVVLKSQIALYLKTRQFQKVLDVLNPLLAKRGDHPEFLLYKAEALNRLGQSDQALATFEKALEMTSKNPAINDQVLGAIGRVGTLDSILDWAEKKAVEREDWVALQEMLAQIYRSKGENEKVLASYDKALGQTQDKNAIVRLKYGQMITYEMMENRVRAIEMCREVLALDPDHITSLNNLSYFLMEQGDQGDEALSLAQHAYALNKTNPDIMDTYAMALLKKEKYAEAELLLRQAIQQQQRASQVIAADFYFHLGQALVGSGQTNRALQQFESALQQIDDGKVASDGETLRQEVEAARDQL